jgi:phosphate transport system substrate-binding protein
MSAYMRNTNFRIRWLAVLLGLTVGAAWAGDITIKGSDTMVLLCQKWAEVYMRENPNAKIQVTGGGSGTGIAALRNNSTDIASASRKMKAEEIASVLARHGERPTEIKTAMDGVCIFVNEENPLKEINLEQLEKIFRGRVQNWAEVGGPDQPIVVYSRENNSGTYSFFKETVLKDADFSARTLTMPGTAALINAVSKDKNGIGYGGVGYATGVKVLPIKGDDGATLLPTEATVQNSKYPLARYLYFYVLPSKNKGEITKFIDWVSGPGGQAVVKEVGYFPIPERFMSGEHRIVKELPAEKTIEAPMATPMAAVAVTNEPAPASMTTPAPTAGAVPPSAAEPAVSSRPTVPAVPVAAPVSVASNPPAPAPTMTATVAAFDGMVDRAVMLAKREMSVATREDALAQREAKLAEREKEMSAKDS